MEILFNKKNTKDKVKDKLVVPKHVGIIMDGNGRWAKGRGLPRVFGHKVGAKVFRIIARHCSEIGIKYLTVYAFSTENWNRPYDEVSALMTLFEQYLKEAISDFQNENIRIKFLGKIDRFSLKIQKLIRHVEEVSAKNDGMVLNIAMNYGGKREIVDAVKMIAQEVLEKNIDVSQITEKFFSNYLYTFGQPDVDLVIRTSGEYRTSNFLIWQAAYAEYVFTDVLWPDFKTSDLDNILILYAKRKRRFGGV